MSQYRRQFPVPNICRNSSVLVLVMMVQLFAIVVTSLTYQSNYLPVLGQVSIYLQWAVLLPAGLICLLRKRLQRFDFTQGAIAIALIGLFGFVLVEIGSQMAFSSGDYRVALGEQFWARASVAIIVVAVLVWMMAIGGRIERWSRAQTQAKVQALQSRIRPHFLFNSLNTIAELAATKPEHAEAATQSLAMLFRAGLEEVHQSHSLQAEINLCKRYVELERWRKGEKLAYQELIMVDKPADWHVPKLILQPLVENAILHGANNDGSVSITLDVRETKHHLSIKLSNSVSERAQTEAGNGMAIENIRERLFVLYDDQQSFKFRQDSDQYQVILRIPKLTKLALEALNH